MIRTELGTVRHSKLGPSVIHLEESRSSMPEIGLEQVKGIKVNCLDRSPNSHVTHHSCTRTLTSVHTQVWWVPYDQLTGGENPTLVHK